MVRNPKWTRDELILALDLYFQCGRKQISYSDQRVIDLSRLLNNLPIHSPEIQNANFRNPQGVSMKLGNFLSVDPQYTGIGLIRGSKLDKEIWDEFSKDTYILSQIAEAIKNNISILHEPLERYLYYNSNDEYFEGRLLTLIHKKRERNSKLVLLKKQMILQKTGILECEACSFDFGDFYGDYGKGTIECHHIIPLCNLFFQKSTKVDELSILCSNCHRVIHRANPMLEIGTLKNIICERRKTNPLHYSRL